MCLMFSAAFGSGVSQAPRRIITAVVERSVMSRTSQDGSPCFCSWDKSDFFFFFLFKIHDLLKELGLFGVSTGR